MNKNDKYVLFFIGGVIIVLFLFGRPDSIDVGPFSWNTNQEQTIGISPPYIKDAIKIQNLTLLKTIYELNENATIYFIMRDDYNLSYNFTVYWINAGVKHQGYSEINSSTKSYSAWYPLNTKGEWKVYILAEWVYRNFTFTTEAVDTITVY